MAGTMGELHHLRKFQLVWARGGEENFTVPTVYEWNLNTQTEFLHNWVLELGYVGSHGIHVSGFLPVAGVTSGGNAEPINLAQLASP